MRIHEILSESPLADYELVGSHTKPGSLNSADLKAARNPKWIGKVLLGLTKCPFNINLYVLNHAELKDFLDIGPEKNVPVDFGSFDNVTSISGEREKHDVERLIKKTIPDQSNSISVIMTNNLSGGAMDHLPLTPWIMGHRISHALLDILTNTDPSSHDSEIVTTASYFDRAFSRTLDALFRRYKYNMDEAYHVMGNTKAIRSGKVSPGEAVVETLTQYLYTGRIKFREIDEDEDELNITNNILRQGEKALNSFAHKFLSECVGKCFMV